MIDRGQPILEAVKVSKRFGGVTALEDVSLEIRPSEVTCLLGDNGAGKSTLIKVVAGVHRPTTGRIRVDGSDADLESPRAALARGIVTVFQDLALIPLMSVWRNVVLGTEPTRGRGPTRRLDVARAIQETESALAELGVDLGDVSRPVATLSGGQRQAVAIARGIHRGARILILDEPTAALGVRQAGIVLEYVIRARDKGIGVVFVTHNPDHASRVGDRLVMLQHGRVRGVFRSEELSPTQLAGMMAGKGDLESVG